jgi:hypothetical protein
MIQLAIFPLTMLILRSKGRFIFLILGALIVLGPTEINFSKIYYFIVLILCSVHDAIQILTNGTSDQRRKLTTISFLILLLLTSTLIGSVLNNSSLTLYLRGNIHFFIFLFGLPISLNSGIKSDFSSITNFILLVGIFSSFSVWYYWSQKHRAYSFSSERIALDADYLAFLGYAYGIAIQSRSRIHKILRFFALSLIPIFLFLSLSRTNFVFLIWLTFLSFLWNRRKISILSKSLLLIFVLQILGVIASLESKISNNSAIQSRIIGTFTNFNIDSYINSKAKTDESLLLREAHGESALNTFKHNLFFGRGSLGAGDYIDHFFGAFAILGVVGFVILCCIIINLINIKGLKNLGWELRRFYLLFYSTILPASLIYNWTANKAFWLSLLCVCALRESLAFQ